MKTCESEIDKLYDLEDAIAKADLGLLLQTFAENVDFASPLPSSVSTFIITFIKCHFMDILEEWRDSITQSNFKRIWTNAAYCRFFNSKYVKFRNRQSY